MRRIHSSYNKIKTLFNNWDRLPKLYFLSFTIDKQGKKRKKEIEINEHFEHFQAIRTNYERSKCRTSEVRVNGRNNNNKCLLKNQKVKRLVSKDNRMKQSTKKCEIIHFKSNTNKSNSYSYNAFPKTWHNWLSKTGNHNNVFA